MGDTNPASAQRARAQLDAIEARLAAHDDVAGAAAVVRDEQLIAYVVAKAGSALPDDALRSHLKAALPAYMVPRLFVRLDALPRATDGTIDRLSLPDPRATARDMAPAPAPTSHDCDPRVDYLIGVWSRLLGVPVGAEDNFFDLGGHSMLAVQMANRVKTDTGVRIQLMTLAAQTLAQIAAELPSAAAASHASLTSRLVGTLMGLLRGGRAAGAS